MTTKRSLDLFNIENLVLSGQSKNPLCGGGKDSWLCLRLLSAELSVVFGAGVSLFCILNIEYRTRNFEQQKSFEE